MSFCTAIVVSSDPQIFLTEHSGLALTASVAECGDRSFKLTLMLFFLLKRTLLLENSDDR